MRYNKGMKQSERKNAPRSAATDGRGAKKAERFYHTAVIGGGAAGLFFAAKYGDERTLIIEKGERFGRKLSASGGGWGNVTNLHAGAFSSGTCGGDGGYFTFESAERGKIERAIKKYPPASLREFLLSVGCVTFADERGRVYPLSRQASSITDCLRAEISRRGVITVTGAEATRIFPAKKAGKTFYEIVTSNGVFAAENVLLCTGGKAAGHFGSDGGGYLLAQSLGHSVTKTYPALVQVKCAEKDLRALKGIRVFDGAITLFVGGGEVAMQRGDILFTEYGVSGDAAFKISSYLPCADEAPDGAELSVDFLPDLPEETLKQVLYEKKKRYVNATEGALFTGILNNRLGETLARRVCGREEKKKSGRDEIALLAGEAKAFTLTITGTMGFDNAQVTKGGVPLAETDDTFQSVFCKNLCFAGEILDVDGACGGYNLQWAYSSACAAAEGIFKRRENGNEKS